jgi:hypothetical protein
LTSNGLRTLFASQLDVGGLGVKESQIENREADTECDAQGGEGWCDEKSDKEGHNADRDRRQGGSAQETWEGICGQVF